MRAVPADHLMFDEAIAAFRPESIVNSSGAAELTTYAVVLSDFEIRQSIKADSFEVLPTEEVHFPGAYAAFIAPIAFPRHEDFESIAYGFALAVSTIMSFATGRPVKVPRDPYHIGSTLERSRYVSLALSFPILIAGPGAHDVRLASSTQATFAQAIASVSKLLRTVEYDDYVRLFRAMRILQLAHQTVRDDFALAYYLLVSAIEVVASRAIPRKQVAERHPDEKAWAAAARDNPVLRTVLMAYKAERGKSQYLRRRFTEFILRYCPPAAWQQLEHPHSNLEAYIEGLTQRAYPLARTRRSPFELYPEDIPEELALDVISNLYKYRSNYTHEGAAPPHRHPVNYNRFFDDELEFDEEKGTVRRLLLPNYRLVAFIAQRSILAYADTLAKGARRAQPPPA
jgi:hypothetical protein